VSFAAAVTAACLAVPAVHVEPGAVRPGDVVLVWVSDATGTPKGTLGDDALAFRALGQGHAALAGLPVEQPEGELPLQVTVPVDGGTPLTIEGSVTVLPENFSHKELHVSRRFTSLSKKNQRWSAADHKAWDTMWKDTAPTDWLFHGGFAWPRPRDISAPFGDKRMFNGKMKSQHYGTDLDGNTGDPIVSANDGVVVMVRRCFASGNTVLVHHGGALFTAYFHMSAFKVKVGDHVKRGQLLGLVGRTGRVTGPHLHFGVKLDGRWVNAESLLALEWPQL